MKASLKYLILILVLVLNLGCDRITKSIAREQINSYEWISIIGDNFLLTKVENTGAFLSLGQNLPEFLKVVLLSAIPVAFIIFALIYMFKNMHQSYLSSFGIAFVIGGGIGNLYDRIIYGSVTDFMFIDFEIFRTGIFNMADVSIMTGVFIIIFNQIKNRNKLLPNKS